MEDWSCSLCETLKTCHPSHEQPKNCYLLFVYCNKTD